MRKLALVVATLLISQLLFAAEHYPYVINFSRIDYDGANQNWDIIENKQGWIYVANNNGLLQFDGSSWQRFEFPDGRYIHSLLIEGERIYAGSYNDFGYFSANDSGEMQFTSLSQIVKDYDYNFGNIVEIFSIDQNIYFVAASSIIKYSNGKLSVIESNTPILSSAINNNSLYIFQQSIGVALQSGTTLTPIITDPKIANLDICEILPLDADSYLLVSRFDGIFRCDDGKISKFKLNDELQRIIASSQIYCAILDEKTLTLGTIDSGAIELDIVSGKHLLYDTSLGLQNNSIHNIHRSKSGNIWLALDNGVSYLEVNTPTKKIYSPSNLYGSGYCSIIYNDTLYIGTNQGLYAMPWNHSTNQQPQLIGETKGQVWALTIIDNQLLCGHHKGVYLIEGNRAELIHKQDGAWNFKLAPNNPNRMLSGSYNGIALYEREGAKGAWQYKKMVDGYNDSARIMEYDDIDKTWWVMYGFGLSNIKIDSNNISAQELLRFENVDSMQFRTISKDRDTLYFCSSNGIYTFDKERKEFEISPRFQYLSERIAPISILSIEENGNVWIADNESIIYAAKNSDEFYIDSLSLMKLKGDIMDNFAAATSIGPRKAILTSIDNGFVVADMNAKQQSILHPSIRTVTKSCDNSKEVIYRNNFITSKQHHYIETRYHSGSVYIFSTNTNNIYQNDFISRFRLVGYNDQWQSLSKHNDEIYNSLREGEYIFELESINTFNKERYIETLTLKITPPWHRTTLAYIAYILIFAAIIALIYTAVALKEQRKYAERIHRHRQITKDKTTNLINRNIEQSNIIEELRAEKLEQELNIKRQELANTLFEASETQKKFGDIIAYLKRIKRDSRSETETKQAIETLILKINDQIDEEDKWDKLSENYNAVHAQFLTRFKDGYPELTNADLRLAAYIRMGLQSKDIAPLLSVSERGVESARYRLRRKLELDRSKSLSLFIQHY